jgi:phage terminase Nu1 subunit (DNA packaging protein)
MICNKKNLADVFGISERTLTEDIKAGMPIQTRAAHRGQSHEFDTADVFAWQMAKALSRAGGAGELDRNQEQARLFKFQASRQELALQRKQADLIPGAVVEKVWSGMTTAARARLLALPSRLGAECALQPFPIIASRAEELIFEALAEIHEYNPSDYQ